MTDDIVVYDGGELGPTVLVRMREGRGSIVIEAGTRHLALSPSWAAQVASGIDAALKHVGRDGRIKQITAPAGSAKTAAPQALPGSGRIGETE